MHYTSQVRTKGPTASLPLDQVLKSQIPAPLARQRTPKKPTKAGPPVSSVPKAPEAAETPSAHELMPISFSSPRFQMKLVKIYVCINK